MSINTECIYDNKYTYDYFSQDNVCRLCWNTTYDVRSIENDGMLAQIITELIGISIKGHILKVACYSCADKIESFSNFKKFCLDADQKLQRILATGQLEQNIKSEHNYDEDSSSYEVICQATNPVHQPRSSTFDLAWHNNPVKLKKEADLELKLLEIEIEKEENDESLQLNEISYNEDDFQFGEEDEFLPVTDDYCYMCQIRFKSLDEKLSHDVRIHKMIEKNSYICYFCHKNCTKYSEKLYHEVQCKASHRISKEKINLKDNKETKQKDNNNRQYLNIETKLKKYQKQNKNKDKVLTVVQKLSAWHKINQHRFKTKKNLEECAKKNKVYKCNYCPSTFDNDEDFQTHKVGHSLTQHTICEVCGVVSKNKHTLKDHMKIHYEFKKLKCPHCDYHATLEHSLNIHIRRRHTTERPYACEVCPYRSATSSNLAAHRRTHTGDRNYVCQLCSKAYRYKAMLNDHIINVHEGKKRYQCKICSMQYFNFDGGLKKHLRMKHGKKVRKDGDSYIEIDTESSSAVNEENMAAQEVFNINNHSNVVTASNV